MDERERELERLRELERERNELIGHKGGTAEAYLGAAALPRGAALVIPIGRVQWGPVFTGLVVSMAVTVLLSALGRALGLSVGVTGFGGLSYWMIGSAAIGLFLGSMLAAKQAKAAHVTTGVWHGLVVWALFLIFDVLFGLMGYFSQITVAARTAIGMEGMARPLLTTTGAWWLFIGYIILLIASVLGGGAGVAAERTDVERTREETHRP